MMSDDGVQTQSSNIVVALDPGHDSTHAGASANGVREEVLTSVSYTHLSQAATIK